MARTGTGLALLLAACAGGRRPGMPASAPSLGPLPAIAIAEDRREAAGVLPAVASPDAALRARAARALGRIGGGEATSALGRLAGDTDSQVAIEALFGLGIAGAGDALPRASARARDGSPRIRAAALECLGRSGDDRLAPRCAEGLRDASPEVRGEAALALFRLAGERYPGRRTLDPVAIGSLVGSLGEAAAREADEEARWREVYALASIRDPRTREALLRASADPSSLVRLFALRGLGKAEGDVEVLSALARGAGDLDESVATEAALAIERQPSPETVAALLPLLDRPRASLRRVAVRALGAASTVPVEVASALDRASEDPSPSVRGEVAVARARRGGEEAKRAVEEALGDRHPLVRAKGAEAAGRLSEEEALPLLERALGDATLSVAAAAAGALGSFRGEEALDLLRATLGHASGLARENAASALARRAREEGKASRLDAVALLASITSAVGEDSAEVRSTLFEALEEVERARRARGGVPTAGEAAAEAAFRMDLRDVLERSLSETDPTARAKARRAYGSLLSAPPPAGALAPPRALARIPGASAPPFRRDPRVRIRTIRGDFEATLFASEAPVHVENFLRIARTGRYAGTPFHRVEPNFVVQGGDHLGDGTGARAAEGGTIRDETNRRRFLRGTIGMPKTDVPDSGGSQIFLTLVPTPHLDGRYTAFGQVDAGIEALDAIEVGDRIEAVEVLDSGR